jgi:hypothetical protein
MKELIAGRIKKDDRPISELMIELFFDGLAGKIVLSLSQRAGGQRAEATRGAGDDDNSLHGSSSLPLEKAARIARATRWSAGARPVEARDGDGRIKT